MAFHSPEKLKPRKIEIDATNVSSESPEVTQRLNRIESNYERLDEILTDLESRMAKDDRLKAIDEAAADEFQATFGIKRKRKWKSATKPRRRKSANPRKPR